MDRKGKSREVGASSKHWRKSKKRKNEGTEIDLHASKLLKQSETTPERVSDDSKVHHSALYLPNLLVAQNFPKHVSEASVRRFFQDKPVDVCFRKLKNDNGEFVSLIVMVSFNNALETNEALKFNGKSFGGTPIYVVRNGNSRAILRVIGFNNQADLDHIREQLHQIFEQHGDVLSIFLPTNVQTGYSLGVAYVYLNHEGKDEDSICQPTTMDDGTEIQIRNAKPKQCFHAEMVGKETIVKEGDKKTALKRVFLPINEYVPTLEETFTWRSKRGDIIPGPYDQQDKNNCWAVALSREYSALLKLHNSGGPSLSPGLLGKLVGGAHQVTGRGIDRLRNAIPAMRSKYVKEMNILPRPRGNNVADFEEYEKRVVELLKSSPVMVSIEYLDSYASFDGRGIYSPTILDCYLRTFEKHGTHCLLLTGYGVENGVEYWELLDSRGSDWGDDGFIRIERHKCLIKAVVELKL